MFRDVSRFSSDIDVILAHLWTQRTTMTVEAENKLAEMQAAKVQPNLITYNTLKLGPTVLTDILRKQIGPMLNFSSFVHDV